MNATFSHSSTFAKALCLSMILSFFALTSCRKSGARYYYAGNDMDENIIDCYESLHNDDLKIVRSDDFLISIKNKKTGKFLVKDIFPVLSGGGLRDTLVIYQDKHLMFGYLNSYTGEILIPAQYSRAWDFSEGLAAVEKGGEISFIDTSGQKAFAESFAYYGNPLVDFTFKNGLCAVADDSGKCGLVDKTGQWVVPPSYEDLEFNDDNIIATATNACYLLDSKGEIINPFLINGIEELTYSLDKYIENSDGESERVSVPVKTGIYEYGVNGKYGMMDGEGKRVTEPIYSDIIALNDRVFSANLTDCAEVLLDRNGNYIESGNKL